MKEYEYYIMFKCCDFINDLMYYTNTALFCAKYFFKVVLETTKHWGVRISLHPRQHSLYRIKCVLYRTEM